MLNMLIYHIIHNMNSKPRNFIRQKPNPCYYQMLYDTFNKCSCTLYCQYRDNKNISNLYRNISQFEKANDHIKN